MPDQLLVLIGSDGKQATVSRSVATQASLVLRDLLDGREPTRHVELTAAATVALANKAPSVQMAAAENTTATTAFATSSGNTTSRSGGGTNIPAVELPFPYFTGDLLQRICAHMTYRYNYQPPNRESDTAKEASGNSGGEAAVGLPGRNVMREIPRPMVLPLSEYLDPYDRRFIEDWDEATTVMMVKAATLLNYEELLCLASAKLAVYLSGKSVEGIRAFLGAEGDFTQEAEAELKKELKRVLGSR
ncbi:S-phase kinase-associated protein 1 [Trypanosoma conorhini]|uniref:S-phase kinase-associated protein 1 n=1 Tax=Trypanosoma conorhini TaxID=83891 RepID=A0A422Q7X0_9TRYP|nr:S-phase kinase-associated protein 1 [Trypanosoma conorhini]RNF26056.1 S-phase kinase-associated protein 1 [Trypanosoma conorhini]